MVDLLGCVGGRRGLLLFEFLMVVVDWGDVGIGLFGIGFGILLILLRFFWMFDELMLV